MLKKIDLPPNMHLPINPSTAPSSGGSKLTLEQLLKSFVAQGYLERVLNGSDGSVAGTSTKGRSKQQQEADNVEAQTGTGAGGDTGIDWRWGPRADAEIGEKNVAAFIETFFDDVDNAKSRQVLYKNIQRAAGDALQPATGKGIQ